MFEIVTGYAQHSPLPSRQQCLEREGEHKEREKKSSLR
jgi:hypothetical protein